MPLGRQPLVIQTPSSFQIRKVKLFLGSMVSVSFKENKMINQSTVENHMIIGGITRSGCLFTQP